MTWKILIMWIEQVPATFWGVLAGSLFTLIGVASTNHANFKRLERQLEHDRSLKTEERKLTLKKDVYLPAAEAISAGLMAIGRLADLKIPQDNLLSDWIEKSPAIAKAQLVADEATAEAIARFNAELGSIMFRLLAIRLPLTTKLQSAESLMQQVTRHSTENDRMLELCKEMNLSGSRDEQRRTTIDSYFQFNQKRIDELLAQHNILTRALFSDQMQFSKDCHQATATLSILLIPLLACARKELKLPFNAENYSRIAREAHEKSGRAWKISFKIFRDISTLPLAMRINLKEKLCTKIWGRVYNPTFRRAALPLGVRPFGESDLKRNTLHEPRPLEGLQELVCPPDFKEIAGV